MPVPTINGNEEYTVKCRVVTPGDLNLLPNCVDRGDPLFTWDSTTDPGDFISTSVTCNIAFSQGERLVVVGEELPSGGAIDSSGDTNLEAQLVLVFEIE